MYKILFSSRRFHSAIAPPRTEMKKNLLLFNYSALRKAADDNKRHQNSYLHVESLISECYKQKYSILWCVGNFSVPSDYMVGNGFCKSAAISQDIKLLCAFLFFCFENTRKTSVTSCFWLIYHLIILSLWSHQNSMKKRHYVKFFHIIFSNSFLVLVFCISAICFSL